MDHGDHAAMFRRRFWLSLALTIPVVIYSSMLNELTGWTPPDIPGDQWIAPVFGTAVFLYGGPVFLRAGWQELRSRRPGMMLLISMGLLVAFTASVASELDLIHADLWAELSTLVTIMLLGHWLEMRALGQAQGALAALAALLPDEAERVTDDGGTDTVALHELRVGDVVLVRPGGRVPADGVVVEGEAEVDESMITGESRPVPKHPGDKVVAGTVVTDSSLRARVDAVGDETALAGIQRLVAEAEASKSRAQALADRAAALLFYVAIVSAAATFAVWAAIGDLDEAFVRTVTVLVIACPHALGLAIPLVISLSTSIAAKAGILIKDRMALERMRTIDVALFDKTGTLTRGKHTVASVTATGVDERTLLALAAAVESDSEHPLAKAIVAVASDRGIDVPRATRFRSLTGRGVEAAVDGEPVAVGGPAFLRERGLSEPPAPAGAAVLYVVRRGEIVGALALEDQVRPESKQAVDDLHRLGVKVVMITGDARQVADAVAAELGVDEVFAEVLPEDKDKAVAQLQGRGHKVAMVGDGVNDAPALARADVGIAIGAGTDVAIESAGVVLASSDPRAVVGVIRLSLASYRKMLQNLAWGAGYNIFAIPLAAGVLAPVGVTLSPAVAAILMSASTIVVALNAQLLRRVDLRPPPSHAGTPRNRRRGTVGVVIAARPAVHLRPFVDSYLGYRLTGPPGIHRGLPARHLTFIVSIGAPIRVVGHPDPRRTPDRYDFAVGGLQVSPAFIAHDGHQEGVSIQLTPLAARALLGVPASALWNTSTEASDVIGPAATELWERLHEIEDWDARFRACDEVLGRLASNASTPDVSPVVREAWCRLDASGGMAPVAGLAADVGWGRRHLSERFALEFGLSPKQAARVMRFDRARTLLARPARPTIAEVAATCGYYDQPHLNRDFVELAGCPPGQWMAEELPSVQDASDPVTSVSAA